MLALLLHSRAKISRDTRSHRFVMLRPDFGHNADWLLEQCHFYFKFVSYRIRFKVLLLTYDALNDLSPEYISELLKYTRNLRSQSQHLLSVPKSRTVTYGDRALSGCALKLWNELPFQLRLSSNIQALKSGLKRMLLKMAYL